MNKYIFIITFIILFTSCKENKNNEKPLDIRIPVTVTSIDTTAIENYIDLNATASFLIKNIIKANITGYLSSVNIQSNDFVTRGKTLFTLKTKEAKVLGNTVNKIDPTLHFGSTISVKAETSGFITNVNVQSGDYVQDGDVLATINDASSFAIVLSLPYELKKYVNLNKQYQVFLPDGKTILATAYKFMPTVDAASQTQNVILKCNSKEIPENLVVKVRITKSSSSNAISLPKEAILTDETESEFWIMKMINTTTAIKIPIEKGIETENRVEVKNVKLLPSDKILISGNYGVADTIKVKIVTTK